MVALLVGAFAPHLSALICACTPIACFLPLWGMCCTARVDSRSGLSLLHDRRSCDSRGSGAFFPSAPADLCCGVRVSPHRCLLGLRNKAIFVSAHTKPDVLCCGVKFLNHQCLLGLRNKATFVFAHTKPAVLCCGVRVPPHRRLVRETS